MRVASGPHRMMRNAPALETASGVWSLIGRMAFWNERHSCCTRQRGFESNVLHVPTWVAYVVLVCSASVHGGSVGIQPLEYDQSLHTGTAIAAKYRLPASAARWCRPVSSQSGTAAALGRERLICTSAGVAPRARITFVVGVVWCALAVAAYVALEELSRCPLGVLRASGTSTRRGVQVP